VNFPENFDLLAGGEDQIRQLSKAAIENSKDLSLHARMIERAMSMLDHMATAEAQQQVISVAQTTSTEQSGLFG
jgi:hypothetical protein